MTVRMAQWPHQEAEGTRRTRSSAVHVKLGGTQCTEHWLLFARTPKRRKGGRAAEKERGRERGNTDENKDAKLLHKVRLGKVKCV